MAKANLGTKRVCPETGRKFYDLEKDPIISPYTGNEYPLSFFEAETAVVAPKPDDSEKVEPKETKPEVVEEELETVAAEDGPEIISLEDAEDGFLQESHYAPGQYPHPLTKVPEEIRAKAEADFRTEIRKLNTDEGVWHDMTTYYVSGQKIPPE